MQKTADERIFLKITCWPDAAFRSLPRSRRHINQKRPGRRCAPEEQVTRPGDNLFVPNAIGIKRTRNINNLRANRLE